MTDALEQKALEIISQLQHLAPHAADVALRAAVIDAAGNLMFGFVWFLASIVCATIWWKLYLPWTKRKGQDYVDGPLINGFCGVALFLMFFISACVSIGFLADLWNWVGLFHPELFLAHKVI